MTIFGLADCNNFYASCERVFSPALAAEPVVVLSNNDGCVIARSNEAKALGIAMGEPAFKREPFFRRHGVHVFSSNYALYGDMSNRVMRTLARFTPEMEVYSIDEAFLDFTGMPCADLEAYVHEVRRTVGQWTGIPVSIGLGTTKTLAKIANRFAKKRPDTGGVFDLATLMRDNAFVDSVLDQVEVNDVWGVGRRYSKMLGRHGVFTARQLRDLDNDFVRKKMTVAGLHTVLELRGVSCIPMEQAPPPKKAIVSSRSFGRPVTSMQEMREAVSAYVSRALEKLRKQGGVAGHLTVFLMTNPHKPGPQYANSFTARMPVPNADTRRWIALALRCLQRIYKDGYSYKKAGVMLTDIEAGNARQLSLLAEPQAEAQGRALMGVLDRVNAKWGRGSLQYAATGLGRPWTMRQLRKSPRFTTSWQELPIVR
jgi:DNA polymerase V